MDLEDSRDSGVEVVRFALWGVVNVDWVSTSGDWKIHISEPPCNEEDTETYHRKQERCQSTR